MKEFQNVAVTSIEGQPYIMASRRQKLEDDEVKTEQRLITANVGDILKFITLNLPEPNGHDSVMATNVYNRLREQEAFKESESDHVAKKFSLEDAEADWVLSKLKEDRVGPRLLGVSHHTVKEQVNAARVSPESKQTRQQRRAASRKSKPASNGTKPEPEEETSEVE